MEADSMKAELRHTLSKTLLGFGGVLRERRLILDTILLGAVGALSARVFSLMLGAARAVFLVRLAGFQPLGLPNEGGAPQEVIGPHGLWLIPVATTLGGLISGILVYSLAPEAEGHGTDTAVKAFHRAAGFIRTRVPPLKMVASAITIGSGGAAGREGPTALISAGIGSVYATLTHRPDEERRLLVLIGMASGLSAIFRSPVGTAFFAIEVLYGGMEFEANALLYTMLGSIVAYTVNGLFVGYQPLFQVPPNLAIPHFSDYFWYVALGIAAGLVATLIPMAFYGIRDLFGLLRIRPHFKPAIGGLAVGLLALALPQVLGASYGWVQEAITGHLSAELLLSLMFAQILAFALTISSGGSGGVFGPSLYVGAMLGGLLAKVFHQPSAPLAIVGMAAVFGGAARVPIATLLMVTEMTGGYHLLVPAALAVMVSYYVEVTLSARLKYKSLYEAQVLSRPDSPAHHSEHLEAAIRLLGMRGLVVPATFSHLDVRELLASGIPVDLPDGKRLIIGILSSGSPYVDMSVQSPLLLDGQDDVQIVAIFRDGHTHLPHGDLKLRAGDRLLVVASPEGQDRLAQHLTPLTRSEVIYPE
jgi:CIC family chloride channel protein